MKSEVEIPEPKDSGSDGSQIKSQTLGEPSSFQPVGRPIANAVIGLANANSRAFGGEVASTLIAGVTSQMSVELDQTRQELTEQRKKNEKLAIDLSNEKIKSAVYSERLEAFRSTRHLKNVGVSVGTLLVGTGIQLIRSASEAYGVACLVVGSVLVIISWASTPKVGDK